jgi:hypothetical protein
MVSGFIFSCSKDDDNNDTEAAQNAIVGEWQATELQIDDATAGDDAKFGKQILDFLTARDCFVLTFDFKADLTVTAENSADYLSINATSTGLDVPCPTESDVNSSTYTYDGSVLTTIDENGQTITVDVTINGDTMTVDAADLDIDNFNDQGKLIFKKK